MIIKKDNSLKFYLDYRNLIDISIKNKHLFPNNCKLLNRFSIIMIFMKLALKIACNFNRIKVREG